MPPELRESLIHVHQFALLLKPEKKIEVKSQVELIGQATCGCIGLASHQGTRLGD